jgi:hypothetical protein
MLYWKRTLCSDAVPRNHDGPWLWISTPVKGISKILLIKTNHSTPSKIDINLIGHVGVGVVDVMI